MGRRVFAFLGDAGSHLYASRVDAFAENSIVVGEIPTQYCSEPGLTVVVVLAPDKNRFPFSGGIDINTAHVSFGHLHELFIHETCKQLFKGVQCACVAAVRRVFGDEGGW